jgi:glycerol-3-phosphate O-acyltransferase
VLGSSPGPAWPAQPTPAALVLRYERTPAERTVLNRWIAAASPAQTVISSVRARDLDVDHVGADQPSDTLVVPVAVGWSVPREKGRTSFRAALATISDQMPLPGLLHPLRQVPEGAHIVVGEPARLGDLRRRFEQAAGADSFAAFIRRQGELALERAERIAVGRYKLPRLVPEEVRASRSFATGIRRLAEQTGRRPQDIAELGWTYLQEMAAAHSRLAIDMFERFGRMLMRAYTVEVDETKLEALRALNRNHTLVFLPNHRSYLDPFVIRSTLLTHSFPANHCFAGNNMSWWPMGQWTRRTGNIILRRSIGDDTVYKFVLREYLGYLIDKRLNLEWYIEGGRTRTGKLRPPRFGLLTYLVDAFEQLDHGPDVYLVPVSIVYDGLPEVASLTAEQRGTNKKSESISWLLNYPRSTGRGFGKVHIGVGEPLSLREALGHRGTDANGDARRHRVERVAFEVCHRINRATPVTSTALVTLALLGVDDRALTLADIEAVLAPFLDYFERRKLPVTRDLAHAGELRRTLDWLCDNGVVVRFDDGLEPVWGISPDRHLDAAFYRNSIVHMLLDRAIVELVLAAAAEGRITLESEAWDEALRLRDLFKFEFFFPDKAEFRHNLKAELALIDADWPARLREPCYAKRILADARPHLAHRALHSFVEAYYVTADRLAAHPSAAKVDEATFVKECFGVARQRRLQRRLRSSDSISTEVFRTALKVAAHRGLLGPGGEQLAQRRHAFATELAELLERVEGMRDLAASDAEIGQEIQGDS